MIPLHLKRLGLVVITSVVLTSSCTLPPPIPMPLEVATSLADGALETPPIGAYGRRVTAASPEAQAWFDQGVRYSYGFNQDQAAACFARAALASPECSMAWWGIAHILSVDINNLEVTQREATYAVAALREAQRLAASSEISALEQALIEAEAHRTVSSPPSSEDRAHLDEAYSDAIGKIWGRASQDTDIGVLYAESLMLLQPWNYWTPDYEPVEKSLEIVALLEACIKMSPEHPGAHHYYIHMVESSGKAERGIPSADILGSLMPGSGHLVHMPSHIYANVGRYADAVTTNERAVALDHAYFSQYKKPTFYLNYYAHNIEFCTFGAMMEGRKALALDYVAKVEQLISDEAIAQMPQYMDGASALRLHVYVRFGMWEEIVAYPDYAAFRKASRAIRRYARTVALANLGRAKEARLELAELDSAIANVPEDWVIAFNPATTVLGVARQIAEAEACWREGDAAAAIELLTETLEIEHNLIYTEPPAWMIPLRHVLGAIQLASGDAVGAEVSYRKDLTKHKENAWSLLGLQQSLAKLGKLDEASALKVRVDKAWARADIEAPASCYCGAALK